MEDRSRLLGPLTAAAEKLGLPGIVPVMLSEGTNLIVHLAPHGVVARMAWAQSEADPEQARLIVRRELETARHLHVRGVPVLPPADAAVPAGAGPHEAGGVWLSLWAYLPPQQRSRPTPEQAVSLLRALTRGMRDFGGELPALGVWERVCRSAERLRGQTDPRIRQLVGRFAAADERMRETPGALAPCHGDAHAGNLLPAPDGWVWTDFEDVSLMPAYWDYASYVANLALFGGFEEPTLQYMLHLPDVAADRDAFGFALTARILMATVGNLDDALAGRGDLTFARRQLALAVEAVEAWERLADKMEGR
ncbi:hypothetical protein J31TS4_19540 [Paenibacillus sp. J31TS4]|uniref:phosphotransferase n=1 Tax=Paenibacillus sp. J31TS4 TaxID=2807195 RepID=UPI001B0F12A4|nr:phosphotransferase [Paenibacillus sp. J31TS4]GIP38674.1 hypothetical protein J31TS4_19540 [Paenibacillus sp. J31TS4]